MPTALDPFRFLLIALAGWINERQLQMIEYLREENRVLREQLGDGRLRLTDHQRRRLAAKARGLGRKVLAELATIVTLETLLRWHRQLIAQRNCHRSGHFHLKNVDALRDFDTCFFRLGVSSVGMSAEDYRRLTYDLTLTVARQLLPGNPRLVFEYISGGGNRCQFAAEVGTCRG